MVKIGAQLSDYEKWRLEKIKKNKALVSQVFINSKWQ